jgi:hypothetical protein
MAAAVTTILLASLVAAALVVAFRDAPARHALAAPGADPVPNDNFGAPNVRIYGDLPFEAHLQTAGATLEAGETAPCGPIGATVWFEFTPQTHGTVEITTAGSNFDTIEAVYTLGNGFIPSPPGANLNSVACSDDAGGPTSFLSLSITRNTTYYIQIGGKDGATGDLALHIACNPSCPPPNDDSTAATYVFLGPENPGVTLRADTRAATDEAGEPRPCGNIGKAVWYQFYADNDRTVVADTSGSGFDTVLAAYSYGANFPASPPGAFTSLACNDNSGGGAQSRITFAARQGNNYWIQAGGAAGATGDLVFHLACDPACPPQNDNLGAGGFGSVPILTDVQTEGATTETGELLPCGGMGKTVWYSVVVRGDTTMAVDTAGSDIDTVVAAYEQGSPSPPPGSLDPITCKAAAGGAQPRVTFHALAEHLYWVQIGGRNGAGGHIHVSIECAPGPCPPESDNPASTPYLLDPQFGLPFDVLEDTRGATTQPGEQLACGGMGRTVWLRLYSAELELPVVIDTAESSFDTAIALYESPFYGAPPIEQLKQVACEAGAAGTRARLRFQPRSSATYFVQIGGRSSASGDLRIYADCVPACPPQNDSMSRAFGIGFPGEVFSENTRGATLEAGEDRQCGNVGNTVWFNLPGQGTYTITTQGTDFPVAIALYSWEGFSPPGGLHGGACSMNGSLELQARAGSGYLLQVGGADGASGMLQILITCTADCPFNGIGGPDTGGPCPGCGLETRGGARGSIALPSTGSGGYLPGARRR